jgi:uncharacterized membrane protein YfcA
MLDGLQASQIALLVLGALGIGFSKSGFAGVSMLHVVIFAHVFGARASTGIILPMLIVGDVCAIFWFGRTVRWQYFIRLLPPTLIGVLLGTFLMQVMDERVFKPVVGGIVLALTCLQLYRLWKPQAMQALPHTTAFSWALGLLAGITTMMANAAGPVVALYLVAVSLPKLELVGTGAWLFLVINLCKLPLSYFALGLVNEDTLWVNLLLAPAIPLGMALGAWCVQRVDQMVFNCLLLAFTGIAALRLLGVF